MDGGETWPTAAPMCAAPASSADDAVFHAAYAQGYPGLVRLARVALDDAALAEEVVQDVFADFYRRAAKVENTGAYLRVAVLHRAGKANRHHSVVRRHLRSAGLPAASTEGHDDLLDAVHRLAPRRRDVVILRYYLDLSEAEIATTLGIPAGTVKSIAHRALRQLREAIE